MAAEFQLSYKKLRYSVTDAGCVGEAAINRARIVLPANFFRLKAKTVPADLHDLRETWSASANEDAVQVT